MSKDYAFPQLPHMRGYFKTVPTAHVKPAAAAPATELSPRLLGDLAQLCRKESEYTKTIDEYTHLSWIAADLDRRWRKAVDNR